MHATPNANKAQDNDPVHTSPETSQDNHRKDEDDPDDDTEVDGKRIIVLPNKLSGSLTILEPFWSDDPECQVAGGTGSSCWQGSIVLARYLIDLHQQQHAIPQGGTFLEVGAGCSGIPTLVASRLRCFDRCWATDGGDAEIEHNLPDLQRNVAANTRPGDTPIIVQHWDWTLSHNNNDKEDWFLSGEAEEENHGVARRTGPFSCICASEVVYEPHSVQALIQALHRLSTRQTLILLYHTWRIPAASRTFWDVLPDYFTWDCVVPADHPITTTKENQQQPWTNTTHDNTNQESTNPTVSRPSSGPRTTNTACYNGLFRLQRKEHHHNAA